MKRTLRISAGCLPAVLAATWLFALDDLAAAMKQILAQRANDFSTIRKEPHGTGEDASYAASLTLPGARQCYIAPTSKPHFSDQCEMFETKNRAALAARYKQYLRALRAASPADWIVWTERSDKPMGETTYIGADRAHPAASVQWLAEGMNLDWYDLSVTFYGNGYTLPAPG